jgi:tight adherence protein B
MRARDEIRRAVKTLTAEGQISARFLGALPVVVFGAVMVMSPGYMDPMLKGPGVFALALAGMSAVLGIVIILRMVRIDI